MNRSPAHAYQAIADDLRALIQSGRVGPNSRLPTEVELAEEHKTTRTTVRNAYAVLIQEGLVERRATAGYFVREIKARTWLLADANGFVDPWRELVRVEGAARTRETTTVRIDHGHAPIRDTVLADLLNLADPGALVVCRSSVRILDGDPVDLTDVYVPYERVKDTAFLAGGDLDVYAAMGGSGRPSVWRDSMVCRNPVASEKARLELPDATGVVEVVRLLTFGDDADPAMVVRSVYSAAGAEFVSARTT